MLGLLHLHYMALRSLTCLDLFTSTYPTTIHHPLAHPPPAPPWLAGWLALHKFLSSLAQGRVPCPLPRS